MAIRATTPSPKNAALAALGANFREVREQKGVSLLRLARHLKCSVNTIRWHEAGDTMMRLDRIQAAAAFLNVSAETLMPTKPAKKGKTKC